ncbi:MAG: BrnA antitoxin family protein [Lachnospira sp.]|nr:BrnA antitoxin family protein [Lachnospira sp.]
MKKEYDFSNAKKNPYAKKMKKQITINIDIDIIDYFKDQSEDTGIPYQTLINLYLYDCASNKKN